MTWDNPNVKESVFRFFKIYMWMQEASEECKCVERWQPQSNCHVDEKKFEGYFKLDLKPS